MVVGLSMCLEYLFVFEVVFVVIVQEVFDLVVLQQYVFSDGELVVYEFDYCYVDVLCLVGFWGQGFLELMFDGYFEVVNWCVLKECYLKLELCLLGLLGMVNVIYFGGWYGNVLGCYVYFVYCFVCDDYCGGSVIQLIVEYSFFV